MIETDDKSSSGPLAPTRGLRFGQLNTIAGVLSEMGRLYRSARRGEMSTPDASRLAFMLNLIRRAVEGTDLERRLATLEAAVAEATK